MVKGKKKILSAGLALYNEYGVANVSQKRISNYLEISPGNLTYHFKKKDSIYEYLYFEFVEAITKEVSSFLLNKRSLSNFAQLIEDWFAEMHKYRFIFIDITYLIRNNALIKNNYIKLVETRKSIFIKILDELVLTGYIKSSEIENQHKLLYDRLHIVSDFYLSSIVSLKNNPQFGYLDHKELFFSSLYPFLTAKGKKEYKMIFKS